MKCGGRERLDRAGEGLRDEAVYGDCDGIVLQLGLREKLRLHVHLPAARDQRIAANDDLRAVSKTIEATTRLATIAEQQH